MTLLTKIINALERALASIYWPILAAKSRLDDERANRAIDQEVRK